MTRDEIKQTQQAIAEAMLERDRLIGHLVTSQISRDYERDIADAMLARETVMSHMDRHHERPSITPERLLEIRQTAQLYGASNGWAGTSGKLATMIVELLRVIDGETK